MIGTSSSIRTTITSTSSSAHVTHTITFITGSGIINRIMIIIISMIIHCSERLFYRKCDDTSYYYRSTYGTFRPFSILSKMIYEYSEY